MKRALAAVALLAASPVAAAEPPPPVWHGIWRGTIGNAPVLVCLDGSRDWKRGSYYYLKRLTPIRLDWDSSQARWNEMSVQDKVQATLHFDKIAASRIVGRWTGGGKSLALTFDRVAAQTNEDFGLCGSINYIRPRLGAPRVIETRGANNGVAYRKLALALPPSFRSVTIESFALAGRSTAIDRINRELAKPLTFAGMADGWIDCMRGNLAAHGVDGDYSESLTPGMIGPRYLTVDHHSDGFCGGAHPYSGNNSRTFDLASGAEIDLNDWLTARAIIRKRYDGTIDEAKMVSPAFRAVILAGWKHSDGACQESFERADFWDIALTRTGLNFTPSLAHVEQACGDAIPISFARLGPWLNAKGKAAVAALPR